MKIDVVAIVPSNHQENTLLQETRSPVMQSFFCFNGFPLSFSPEREKRGRGRQREGRKEKENLPGCSEALDLHEFVYGQMV